MECVVDVVIIEKEDGPPAVSDYKEYVIPINPKNITLFTGGKIGDEEVTQVRMACGATLTVMMSDTEFTVMLEEIGVERLNAKKLVEDGMAKRAKSKSKKKSK